MENSVVEIVCIYSAEVPLHYCDLMLWLVRKLVFPKANAACFARCMCSEKGL